MTMMPRGVTLHLAGAVIERDSGRHVFHVHVEEGCGETALLRGEDVEMPWLRAACSCGWRDGERYTIEENAYARWAAWHMQDER